MARGSVSGASHHRWLAATVRVLEARVRALELLAGEEPAAERNNDNSLAVANGAENVAASLIPGSSLHYGPAESDMTASWYEDTQSASLNAAKAVENLADSVKLGSTLYFDVAESDMNASMLDHTQDDVLETKKEVDNIADSLEPGFVVMEDQDTGFEASKGHDKSFDAGEEFAEHCFLGLQAEFDSTLDLIGDLAERVEAAEEKGIMLNIAIAKASVGHDKSFDAIQAGADRSPSLQAELDRTLDLIGDLTQQVEAAYEKAILINIAMKRKETGG